MLGGLVDKLSTIVQLFRMKEMSVGEFKREFSSALERVRHGEPVAVTYGRKREVVAVLSPPGSTGKTGLRKLGRYCGKARVRFGPDWEMSDDELLDS